MTKQLFRRQRWGHSVMSMINLSLLSIITITLLSIFFSLSVTQQADNDARAINLSGSMRMQSYHIGFAASASSPELKGLIKKLDTTWQDPLFRNLQAVPALPLHAQTNNKLALSFQQAYQHWFTELKPYLLNPDSNTKKLNDLLAQQVALTDKLVSQFQREAETKIQRLRRFQLISMLITVLVGLVIFYLLKQRVEVPLGRLSQAAKGIRDGDLKQHIPTQSNDELGLLADSFNQMSQSITETYQQLESRVALRTQELQQSNTILEYSFKLARKVLANQDQPFDFSGTLLELASLLAVKDIQLRLFTHQDEQPYLYVDTAHRLSPESPKPAQSSANLSANPTKQTETLAAQNIEIIHQSRLYGVITIRPEREQAWLPWQATLCQSTADQLAIALSLEETKQQERRFAMLNERTVIARELHDSLAQSLSYLKIQVTRLQKSHDLEQYDLQQAIIDELREGLSSAYRHLRELLTTFRLKIDEAGLKGAIEQTVSQLQTRSEMDITLHYQLANVPLSPSEEIHLLQIIREASQNAVSHSQGSQLNIALTQEADTIQLTLQDNGIGLGEHPEKLNHYGLAIMQERSRHLNAELHLKSVLDGIQGTRIELRFRPEYLCRDTSEPA